MGRVTRASAAISGALAALVSLGVTELLAGFVRGVPSLVTAVGDAVIDTAPADLLHWGIQVFARDDKVALAAGIWVVAVLVGAGIGIVGRYRRWVIPAGFVAFGALGVLAAARLPQVSLLRTIGVALIGADAGVVALLALLHSVPVTRIQPSDAVPTLTGKSRRSFLALSGSLVVFAAASAVAGELLLSRVGAAFRTNVRLPRPRLSASAPPPAASLRVGGITPLVTTNASFYRIDTALRTPRLDPEQWTLRVRGMVDEPYALSFKELLALPMVEEYVTLACVSNEVGGSLISTARWQGVPLADLFARARVHQSADQLVGRAVDGFTAGLPTAAVTDGRIALVAVGMNGEPLPFEHGFPARLVVSGLYGYSSATKWLSELELTTFDSFDAFWVQRGWAQRAPIKTQSGIDVPRDGRSLRAARLAVAGVAWAPPVGVSRVEVQIDDEPWVDARLAAPISVATWRQWVRPWDASPGHHVIRVRATNAEGHIQTERAVDPIPDGATGYHTIAIDVR